MKTYKDLDIYNEGLSLFIKTHKISLILPKLEMYELGSQLRRSSDSVVTNIVEGYSRRLYKNDFIKFLIYSEASNNETIHHLEKLIQLYPTINGELKILQKEYEILGARIHTFIKYVINNWKINKQQTNK
jgi:four helix bundle protein